jgi:AcrR family transcriptional regulator
MAQSTRRLEPRKTPKQPRAVETQARILEAAARVFCRHGYAAGTTNRIAAAAGMSIGSLYQYFPNKDAILVALMRKHVAEGTQRVLAVLDDDGLPPALDGRVAAFVDAALDSHAHDRRLHQVLFEEAPRPRPLLDHLRQTEEELVALIAALLRDDPEVTVPDPAVAARVAIATIESVVHRFVSAQGSNFDSSTLRGELIRMVTRYLTS